MSSSSLCARCNSFSEWYLASEAELSHPVTPGSFIETPIGRTTSRFPLHASYESLKASARAECALCDLICYDISLFSVRNYGTRRKIANFEAIAKDVDAYLKCHVGQTRVELRCLIGPSRSSSYGVKYQIGDGLIDGRLSIGDVGIHGAAQPSQAQDSFNLASEWISKCLTSHDNSQCGPGNVRPYIPKRLVDVEVGSADLIRLVISADFIPPKSAYVALSYCWGLSMPNGGKTTENTLEMHLKGISMAALPLTIQDAIAATRRLGVRYLWVDSLCILQDSREDWEIESAEMSNIYSHSFCTIAAAASNHCDGGMLLTADRRRFSVVTLADNLFVKAGSIPHQDLKNSNPLSTRAWALQERELSPRVLWFTAHELLFECHGMWASEEYPVCDIHAADSSGALDRIFDCYTLNGDGLLYHHQRLLTLGGIYLTWRRIIERYSLRLLTHPTDKLPAISGLAHEINASYGGKYAAGIWIEDLPRALLWRRAVESTLDRMGGTAELWGGEAAISELSGNERTISRLLAHNVVRAEVAGDANIRAELSGTEIANPTPIEVQNSWAGSERVIESPQGRPGKSKAEVAEFASSEAPPLYEEGDLLKNFGTLELVSDLGKREGATTDSPQEDELLSFVHPDSETAFLAPSWSWAAVEGPINYRSASLEFIDGYDPSDVEILAVNTSKAGANSMGEVSAAYIRLSACIRPLREWLNIVGDSWSEDWIRFDTDKITTKTPDVFILAVLRRTHHYYVGSFVYDCLLIMEQKSIFGPGYEYRRVGLIRHVQASWICKVKKREIVLV